MVMLVAGPNRESALSSRVGDPSTSRLLSQVFRRATLSRAARLFQCSCGDQRLSQAQSSIACRNFAVREHLEAISPQTIAEALEQIHILEGSSAQTNAFQTRTLPQPSGDVAKHLHHTVVEPAADVGDRNVVAEIVQQSFKKPSRVDNPALAVGDQLERISALVARAANGHLQFNCRLRFIVHLTSNSRQCRDSVEQPAATGSQRRVDALLHHTKQHVEILRRNALREGQLTHEIATEVAYQTGHSHAPRCADGCFPARQRDIGEVRCPLKAAAVSKQHFPSPDTAICTIARTVKREADDTAFEVVLRHAACDVRVMVLHPDLRQLAVGQCPAGRKVIRMQIVSNGQGGDLQNALQVFDGLFEEAVAFCVLEVPDMLREKGMAALGQADGVLQFAADGEYRWHILAQKNWHWNKSARAAQLPRTPAGDSGHGIVTAQQDIAVVDEKAVSLCNLRTASLLAMQIGSSLRLALVITSAIKRPSANSKWCNGVYGKNTPR